MSVRNNETQMLAGLLQRNDRNTGSGLPGLSRIPLLDRIFGTRSNEARDTELVLLLTPRILRNQAVPAGNVMSFGSGTENRISTERDVVSGNESARIPPPGAGAPQPQHPGGPVAPPPTQP